MARVGILQLLSLISLIAPVQAFSVGRSPVGAAPRRMSTRLYAAEEEQVDGDTGKEHGTMHEDHMLPEEKSSDILNSPAFLKRKIDVLRSDIEKADMDLEDIKEQVDAGKAEWGQQLDDLQLEYKKIQERMTKQNSEGDDTATVQVVRKMLEVLDNYDRAFGVVTAETPEQQEIEDAYKASYQKILDTFDSLGVTEVKTVGTEFDYEVHQAVMQRPSDYEEGIVCEELQKGFILGDKLIRAAMVSVSA